MDFVLTNEHGWALAAVLLVVFEGAIFSLMVGRVRSRVFNGQFMDEKFGDLHFKTFQSAVSKNGYPDMGNGRYSEHLNYRDWYDFNNAQRVHYNYLENVNSYVVYLLAAALYHPFEAAILGAIIFVFRLVYAITYLRSGSDNPLRGISSLICVLTSWVALGYGISSAYQLVNLGSTNVQPIPSNSTPAPSLESTPQAASQ
jgi:uncharacterized membrane protein YecN with MAPEG domain